MSDVDLKSMLHQQVGPLPMGAWIFGGTVLSIIGYKFLHKSSGTIAASGASGPPSDPGQFSSTVSRTDPITGDRIDYTANGPNSSIMSPAQMVYGAGPMGYQTGGDVYVNLPAETNTFNTPPPVILNDDDDHHHDHIPLPPPPPQVTTTPVPVYVPPPPPPPPPPPAGQWYSFKQGDSLWDLSKRFYGQATYDNWHKIWNDPRNSWLVQSTGGTTDWHDQGHYRVPIGSRIWVPA